MSIIIKSAIFCDLIRQEMSGKFIFIGVYAEDIVFKSLPSPFAGSYWLEITPWGPEQTLDFETKVEFPGQPEPRINHHQLPVTNEDSAILVIRLDPINITSEGELKLSMKKKGGRWKTVLSRGVKIAPSAS